MKEPRVRKLDAKKRAEYEAEVANADAWNTAHWTTWTVTGRVVPERYNVTISAVTSQGTSAAGRFRLRLQVTQSHIAVVCAVEKSSASIPEISDIVRSALVFPVDYIAFQLQGAYEIVLDLCINNQSGEALPFPSLNRYLRLRTPVFASMHSVTSRTSQYLGRPVWSLSYQPPCTILRQPSDIHVALSSTAVWLWKSCVGTSTHQTCGIKRSVS